MCLLNLLKSLTNSDNKTDRTKNNKDNMVFTLLKFHAQVFIKIIFFF